MFEELKLSATPEQKVRLYNSFASGLFKYNHTEKAMTIVDEMKRNNIPIDLATYNHLLRFASSIKESYDLRWQFVTECLQEMKQNSIQPNLRTFNAVLYTLRRCSSYERGPALALSILNEMQQCGIEPSLGSWAHVIMIFYPNDQLGYETQILPQIMDELEKQYQRNGNQLHWKDPDDSEFFFNAMFKATVNCRDVDLGNSNYSVKLGETLVSYAIRKVFRFSGLSSSEKRMHRTPVQCALHNRP
jgi:pentatricopeptide repeat domain-containing protein 3